MKLTWPNIWPFRKKRSVGATTARAPPNRWPLSLRMLSWNAHDHVHLFDAVTGFLVLGGTGSTKSTTTVECLTKAALLNGCGAIFFAVKPEDPENALRQVLECGRRDDVVLLGPSHPTTMSFIEQGIGYGGAGLAANITTLLSTVSGLASGNRSASGSSGREDGSFWEKLDNRLISSCTALLMRAGQPVNTIRLEQLVLSLPRSREQVGDEDWRERSYLFHCLRVADQHATNPEDREEVSRLADFFLIDQAQIGDKMRATVQTSVGATLDLFNQPLARRLTSSPTPNFRMEQLQEGKILIIDLPIMTYGAVAAAIQKTLKFVFQLTQNRRDVATNPRPVAMICDEAQAIIDLELDAAFGCTARSTRTICIYSTQSISNLLALSPGPNGEARVHSLLGNLQCKVVHATSDTKTVEYVQSLVGKHSRLLMQGGTQQQGADWAAAAVGLTPPGSVSAGYSEHVDFELQAEHFQALAKGGPPHWTSEAFVIQGGKRFVASGKRYLLVR